MDNCVDLPGYKCYLDAAGRRPAVSVCFLDLEADPAARTPVNGLCLPVDAAELAALDRRERNYERIDVSERVEGLRGARVWTYRGSPPGRARFDAAVRAGTAVIHAGYLRAVRSGFRALGEGEWEACAPSVAPGALPVVELVRHELPERQ
jgi:dephospho-CoA kinase